MSVYRVVWSLVIFAFALGMVTMRTTSAEEGEAVRLIFDTDLESDVDDAGTVALLHALADRGEVKLLAMGISSRHPYSAPCLDALNTYYGRGDIPIGVPKGEGEHNESKYAKAIAEEFPHDLASSTEAPSAVSLYRRVLASQPDQSVVIVTVGFLTNIRDLLASGPDDESALSGKQLVERKVKAWVCMGGAFPEGREWNVFRDAEASRRAIAEWPAPIVFSGYEIGKRVKTGDGLSKLPEDHPVRRAYELYNGLKDRESWDQTAALYAVRGLGGGLEEFWAVHRGGSMHVKPDGSNVWREEPDRRHAYLVEKLPPEKVAAAIEALMLHVPDAPGSGDDNR